MSNMPNPQQVAVRRANRVFGEKKAIDALNLRSVRTASKLVATYETPEKSDSK
jgi:hypothetical protein